MKDSKSAQTLRARITALMNARRWNQSETARRLKHYRKVWDQPRLNRITNGKQAATVDDIDDLAKVFGVPTITMLHDQFGQVDRRSGTDRRMGGERRVKQEAVWTVQERELWPAAFKKKA